MAQPSHIVGNFRNSPFKNGAARDNDIGASGHNAANIVLSDAPINLNVKG
jgi:hypothetical protein